MTDSVDRPPVVLSYGGGTNSKALLVELVRREEPPDLVMFADTGGEKPETYADVWAMAAWCTARAILFVLVRNTRTHATLEEHCLATKHMPSLAYGWRSCSVEFKQRPQERWLRQWPPAQAAWARGERVTKLIGIDWGEQHRAKITADERFAYRYPLLEWLWDRAACRAAIAAAGLALPGKSACFFCPASTVAEILQLAREHPALYARAVAIEAASDATNRTVRGLGRRFAWRDVVDADAAQSKLFPEPPALECGCFDGDDTDG